MFFVTLARQYSWCPIIFVRGTKEGKNALMKNCSYGRKKVFNSVSLKHCCRIMLIHYSLQMTRLNDGLF